MINLLNNLTHVETPIIAIEMAGMTFGVYNKENQVGNSLIRYPNFVRSLNASKVNGSLNEYTIQMEYAVRAGDDPNFLEAVFAKVGIGGTIKLKYGDMSTPSLIYEEQSAILNKVKSSIDVASSKLVYTLYCISSSLAVKVGNYNFSATFDKPSTIIKNLLYKNNYGLLDIFYGMRNKSLVDLKGVIASDDKSVPIEAKTNISILDYLAYLVNCMTPESNIENKLSSKSFYMFTIIDSPNNLFEGPYFKISKVEDQLNSNQSDMYSIDIGYPDNNYVLGFTIDEDDTYSIYYNYTQELKQNDYSYSIDDNGKIIDSYSPQISKSNQLFKTTQVNKNWWSKVTSFPIHATLKIKGLLKPALLMSYLKINVYFFGRKHISSGVYAITRQQDSIDRSGYNTTLTLIKIKGDEDTL